MAGAVAPVTAVERVPKVALIVGPAGSLTNAYRRLANEAADAGVAAGAEVVRVYSPDATWPAVKRAVEGASIIVYLGHGNGWPSPYRSSLYPRTQNGFGLNPTAGGDDDTHQYFGETSIARLNPAPNAVVVFSHLCYASGNSEPGLPEGSRDVALQRVDNYAAGFLAAGARAVVAEAALGPAYYVRALLRSSSSIERIWANAPTSYGRHSVIAASSRTPGYTLRLDPRHADRGWTRSLVARGVTGAELRSAAMGTTAGSLLPIAEPSLASTGIRFAPTTLRAQPIAATTTRLTLPLAAGRTTSLPSGAMVSLRWDPILLDAPPAPAPSVAPPPSPSVASSPATSPPAASPNLLPIPTAAPTVDPNAVARFGRPNASTSPPDPSPSPIPGPTPTPAPIAPEIALVTPERPGTILQPIPAKRGVGGLSVSVAYPSQPGLYRLSVTLHTAGGVAYDAATQALLTPVLVRVAGPIAAAYGAPATLSAGAGTSATIAVKVLNAGTLRWDALVPATPSQPAGDPAGTSIPTPAAPTPTPPPTVWRQPDLVATWISTEGLPVPDAVVVTMPFEVAAPGGMTDVLLDLRAPDVPGTYLLLLDVVTAVDGPLSALGTSPAIIRVTVNPLATPAPASLGVPAAGLPSAGVAGLPSPSGALPNTDE